MVGALLALDLGAQLGHAVLDRRQTQERGAVALGELDADVAERRAMRERGLGAREVRARGDAELAKDRGVVAISAGSCGGVDRRRVEHARKMDPDDVFVN